ncbi:tRNA arginine adenosine deaminase [Tasmannia lanceolata]|uniref:tRNA arginine adenosine deaminase n=1 Tax=Tasmannia lanceolata TaxID=3420 RepID=UPI0040629351
MWVSETKPTNKIPSIMDTYVSSSIAFRNKGSFSLSDFCLLNERLPNSCLSRGAFSIHGFTMNPRVLYGLRQSTLIQWSASRRMILAANGYCRLAAVSDPRRSDRVFYPQKEMRRERRVACVVWERRESDLGHEGNVEEMLSLLTDFGGKSKDCVRERNGEFSGESLQKANVCRQGVCRIEKKGRVDDHSRKEDKYGELGSLGSSSKSEIKYSGRYRGSRREDSLNEDNVEGRKDGSSSSYYSVSSVGDVESSPDRGFSGKNDAEYFGKSDDNLRIKHKKVIRESSSDYKNDSRQGKVDAFEGKFEQFRKYEDAEHYGERLKRRTAEVERASAESTRQKNGVTSDMNSNDSEWSSMKESENLTEVPEFRGSDIQRASSSQMLSKMRMKDRQENSTSSGNLVRGAREQFTQNDQKVVALTESRNKTQKLTNISAIREDNTERASSNQKLVNTKLKYWEENTTSDVNLVEERREQYSKRDQQVIGQAESREKSQQFVEVSMISNSDIERTSSSRRLSRMTVNDREQNSTLNLNLVQEGSEQCTQTDQRFIRQTGSINESQKLTNISKIHMHDAERANDSQRVFKMRMDDREENSTSVVNIVQKPREQHNITDERVVGRFGPRKESVRLTKKLESYKSDTERASSSQKITQTKPGDREQKSMPVPGSEAREQQIGSWNEEEKNTHVMVIPPQSQRVARGSTTAREPTTYATQESVSNTLFTHLHNVDDSTEIDEMHEEHSGLLVNDDTLGSANRLGRSSAHFVGEFADRVRQEMSTSQELPMGTRHTAEIQKARTSSETTSTSQQSILDTIEASRDEKYVQQGFGQYVSEDFQFKGQGSRQSSAGTGTKGPSDEMWDVLGPSSQETSGTEAPKTGSSTVEVVDPTGPSNDGNAIVRRSGRSLWSYIGDMVRKGWGARADSHNSTPQPGAKSSSHESVTSEDWFSGHEQHDSDDDDENVKEGRGGIPKEPLPIKKSVDQTQPKMTPTQRQEASEGTSLRGKVSQVEAGTSASMGTLESGSTFMGTSSSSGEENFMWIEVEKRRQAIPSSVETVGSSLPLVGSSTSFARRLTAASDKEEISESRKVLGSGFTELHEEPIEKLTETSGTEEKYGELKQRKLQRNKQVLKERFDEWEEAFKHENEQRKIDEMYMRIALLEAKKAADTWEVPVGAVLVQNGKIIARGCNLVEELRDSTAHAEMICIREASNQLRTWRLAGATLYVTLEPCPMCAGAILQARIDTVVWGAPNKLLGADGSWVSLFPSREEGGDGSDPSNRPAGPIHPFHPNITIRRGILATECSDIMQQFFQLRRKNKKQDPSPSRLPVLSNPTKLFTKVHDIFSIMFCL